MRGGTERERGDNEKDDVKKNTGKERERELENKERERY
jgi:hypothetical protein